MNEDINEEIYTDNYYSDDSDIYKEEIEEYNEFEYNYDTVYMVFNNLSDIINRSSLPVGEFITIKKLEKFLENYIN